MSGFLGLLVQTLICRIHVLPLLSESQSMLDYESGSLSPTLILSSDNVMSVLRSPFFLTLLSVQNPTENDRMFFFLADQI
jgi:hypothetical protein